MTLHVVGDSHALTFKATNNCTCHWIGAVTAFNLWKKNSLIMDIIKTDPQGDFFFTLGEIDCRIHIYYKSKSTGVPEYVLINNTLESYLSYLDSIKRQAKVYVMTVTPTGVQENVYNYPFYANRKKRQEITDYFNAYLETDCARKGIKFVDIWYPRAEFIRNVWPSTDFEEDGCHIKVNVASRRLETWVKENLK